MYTFCSSRLQLGILPKFNTVSSVEPFSQKRNIACSSSNITNYQPNTPKRLRKLRILAILGDDTGLDLKSDRLALNTLKQVAEIELVTWQLQQPATEIKQQIQRELTDEQG